MDSEQNTKNKSKRLLYIILLAVFAIAFVIIAALMIHNRNVEKKAKKTYDELASKTESTEKTEPEKEVEEDILAKLGITVPEKNLNWEELWATNPDIYAWIYIPGTNIDYPVLQHVYDDTFYLEHNLDGSEGYPGCIYTEMANNMQFTDKNTLIYGHDMKDGSMFQNLHKFEDEAFFNENRYVFIYMPKKVLVYDIFAAYEFGNEHILNNYDFNSDEGYQAYLDQVFQIREIGAHFRDGVTVGTENHIITMSTCIATKPDNRYLVQAVLVNEPALEENGD